MEVMITKKIEVNVTTIEVDTAVRYWEDSYINGFPDIDLYEVKGEGKPKMPCAEKVKKELEKCIYSDHWRWRPIIDIESGKILNWEQGVEANVHYKVCDEFACTIKDREGNCVVDYEDYVPKFMCPKEEGWGDYIIMDINTDGYIQGWQTSLVEEFIENDTKRQYNIRTGYIAGV